MPKEFDTSIDRRKFLGLGALGSVIVAGGCGQGADGVQTDTNPPAVGGNRKKLEALQKKGEALQAKNKK